MKIEFTNEQFKDLLKVVCLGNWLANAFHDGSKEDPMDKKIEEIEDYVFSFAKEVGFSEYVDYDDKFKKYFPTNEMDELCQTYNEGTI